MVFLFLAATCWKQIWVFAKKKKKKPPSYRLELSTALKYTAVSDGGTLSPDQLFDTKVRANDAAKKTSMRNEANFPQSPVRSAAQPVKTAVQRPLWLLRDFKKKERDSPDDVISDILIWSWHLNSNSTWSDKLPSVMLGAKLHCG